MGIAPNPKKLLDEFKAFALKGNMIDLAVAVIIGGAFGVVVSSLVADIFMPLLAYIIPGKEGYEGWVIGKDIRVGKFLAAVINFLVIAFAVFIMVVKFLGFVMRMKQAPPAPPAGPTSKECPLCCMSIPIKATRCGHCTADLPV